MASIEETDSARSVPIDTTIELHDQRLCAATGLDRLLGLLADELAAVLIPADEDGDAVVQAAPTRPSPVVQGVRPAGLIELF